MPEMLFGLCGHVVDPLFLLESGDEFSSDDHLVVAKPPVARTPATVTCVNGVYRAGCAGPNGAAVVRKPY
jgi:hypothetical protein